MNQNKKNFLNKLFIFFFKSKWVFKFPVKKKIIIFDGSENYVFSRYLDKKYFDILFTRQEVINIPILLISFFTKKYEKLSFNYYYNYINYIRPKVIVTYIDNDLFFYRLKNEFKDCTMISVQNGHRGEDLFSSLRNHNKYKLEADYIFVFN